MSKALAEQVKLDPNMLPMTLRHEDIRVATSSVCGKFVPVKAIPLLREDKASGGVSVKLELEEMSEMLMNAVTVRAYAYLVPKLALERFQDMGSINRSYMSEPEVNDQVIPWFKQHAYDVANPIYKTMGLHATQGEMVNDEYLEAYNVIWNYRAKKRSRDIQERTALETTLAPALWPAGEMAGILSSFDQAAIDAEVPISFLSNRVEMRGAGRAQLANQGDVANVDVYEIDGPGTVANGGTTYTNAKRIFEDAQGEGYLERDASGIPLLYGEIPDGSVTMSMSLMEMAKKAAQQAHIRERYKDIPEEHIVDILMEGINVPEELLNRPILLDRAETIFGYSRRFATDSGNLEKSLTTGQTIIDLQFSTPKINTGGVIMVCLEVVPERVFERQMDHYFHAASRADIPNNQADFLDPEKVSIVTKKEIDVRHTLPDETFGYRPLNMHWNRDIPQLGGKYFRNDPNAVPNENRNKIWASEVVDPELTDDWYLATSLNDKVFAVQNVDQLNIHADGRVSIVGLTQFGQRLVEDSDSYEKIIEQVDRTPIDQS